MSSQKYTNNFFALIKDALLGRQTDFTTGSINKAIALLAIPMVIEMLLESLFSIVDIYFVNQLGPEASSTVILTEASLTILYSIAWGLAMATTALVARRIGEKNPEMASKIAAQAINLAVIFSLLISVIGIIFPKQILGFMGASNEVVKSNYLFTQIMLGGNIVIVLLFVNNGIFRGAGNASIAMQSLIIANGINIILDPLLIKGIGPFPQLGVLGAAVATTIGRSVGVIYQLYHLFNGKAIVQLIRKIFIININLIKSILNTSYGAMFQFLIGSCSWIFLARIIASEGTEVTAGYGTAIRICIFTILPAWGIANAAATLVGQNLGANQAERAEKSVWRCAFLALCFFLIVAVIFFVFGNTLMLFFINDNIAVKAGTTCLQILALGYIFFAYGMVLTQAFNGAGDTRTPTVINLLVYWVFQIPLAYAMAEYFHMHSMGVYVAIVIAETILAITAIIIFKKGRWKTVKV